MFSPELYPIGQDQCGPELAVETAWDEIGNHHAIQAGLVVRIDSINNTLKALSSFQIPKEPFNGTERSALIKLVEDCFSKYPRAHVHACSHLEIAALLPRLSHKVVGVTRAIFIPTTAYGVKYIFLGFPAVSASEKTISAGLLNRVDRLLCFLTSYTSGAENVERLRVTELFVKEVGHDIASSIQAIVAKIRTIRDGRVPDHDSMKRKVAEIEREINNAYGVADKLGLAIDANYHMRSFADFDIVRVVADAIEELSAEAQERNIKFEVNSNVNGYITLLGDQRAIQQCLMQLLLNAIKYSYGGTFIKVAIVNRGDSVSVHVTNRGYELPRGDEAIEIWDFGVRGRKAKELHVNGSGIGLFTVRKIIVAHRGQAWAEGNGEMTTFSISIPKREQMRKALGLLC